MEEQRERARRDAAAKREVVELADLPAMRSSFTGYDEGLEAQGTVVALLKDGKPVDALDEGDAGTIVLDRTSFYAERGGQIGDRGRIDGDEAAFDVRDTQYMGEAIAHSGVVLSGSITLGQSLNTSVDPRWRREIRRHHTSAHLLQRALKDVLGEEVNQAGSWVGIDRMRFDFRWPQGALTPEQKRDGRASRQRDDPRRLASRYSGVAARRGQKNRRDLDGRRKVRRADSRRAGRSVDRVLRRDALAFDRRARHVRHALRVFDRQRHPAHRVVRIRGCRRISRQAERSHREPLDVAGGRTRRTARSRRQAAARGQRFADGVGAVQGQVRRHRSAVVRGASERRGDRTFVGAVIPEANGEALRHLGSAIRNRLPSGVVALAGVDDGSVSLLVSATDDLVKAGVHAGNLVKLAAPLVSGKGGGQAAQAQGGGSNVDGAEAAVRAIRDAVLV